MFLDLKVIFENGSATHQLSITGLGKNNLSTQFSTVFDHYK